MQTETSNSFKRSPFEPDIAWLRAVDQWLRHYLKLESGANIFPLLHIVAYYIFFVAAIFPGFIESPFLLFLDWCFVVLLNYSLSIGVLHLHAHRRLFESHVLNRIVEFFLCFPSVVSYPMMRYMHVYQHHIYSNGHGDRTSTQGYEHGWRAVGYWIRYAAICQRETAKGLFGNEASSGWRKFRIQHVTDTLGTIGLVLVLFIFVDTARVALFWHLPLAIVFVNIGFFAWLTHAPAFDGELNGSLNTTNRWANVLMHNQGYHVVHHRFPGIHWTQIPSQLDVMLEVDKRLIVPYWVTLPSVWRITKPHKFHNAEYGAEWKESYLSKRESNQLRLKAMPYFGWI